MADGQRIYDNYVARLEGRYGEIFAQSSFWNSKKFNHI